MSKKLKIQFWRAKLALAMQILEQEGLPKYKEDGFVNIIDSPWIGKKKLFLRGDDSIYNWKISRIEFDINTERDTYLQKVVNAITDELFTGEGGELKVGEMCEVRDNEDDNWKKRKLIAILPEKYDKRFIAEKEDYPYEHYSWDCARPIGRTEPKIEECGNVITYTWEEK